MKKIIQILCKVFILFIFQNNSFAHDRFVAKVAIVDIKSILEHSDAVNQIKKSVNLISDCIQGNVLDKESDLRLIEAELLKEIKDLTEHDSNKKVTDFHKKVSITQKEVRSQKSSLEKLYAKSMSNVHKTIIEIIADLAKKYDFNLVLPMTQVLFVNENLDITLEVITYLNKNFTSVQMISDELESYLNKCVQTPITTQ